ncbi:MAG: hypothetical protein IIX01_01870 [Clostridia bacterium]|nr:hypothetical protein [Clostridia bacterium]
MSQAQKQKRQAFAFRFSKSIVIFSILAILLCIVGVFISVFRLIKEGVDGFYDIIKSPLLIVVCLAGIVVLISLFIKAEYVVDEKYLRSNFGVVRSRVQIAKITALVSDPQSGKVSVYVGEEFFVAILQKGQSEDFAKALLSVNPKIDYSFTLTENKPPEEEK